MNILNIFIPWSTLVLDIWQLINYISKLCRMCRGFALVGTEMTLICLPATLYLFYYVVRIHPCLPDFLTGF